MSMAERENVQLLQREATKIAVEEGLTSKLRHINEKDHLVIYFRTGSSEINSKVGVDPSYTNEKSCANGLKNEALRDMLNDAKRIKHWSLPTPASQVR